MIYKINIKVRKHKKRNKILSNENTEEIDKIDVQEKS